MNFAGVKLGRLPKDPNAKHLMLAKYLRAEALPPVPTSWDGYLGGKASPKMYGNDRFGNCTIAALANHARLQAAVDGRPLPDFTDDEVIAYYMKLSGGQDTGLIETDVLDYACASGFPLDGRYKFRVRVTIDPANLDHMKLAMSLFGGLYLGLALPVRAQGQEHWSVQGDGKTGDDAPSSWGDHAAICGGFDATPSPFDRPGQPVGNVSIETWGGIVYATQHWLVTYLVECYAVLDESHLAMPGLDVQALLADAQALNG